MQSLVRTRLKTPLQMRGDTYLLALNSIYMLNDLCDVLQFFRRWVRNSKMNTKNSPFVCTAYTKSLPLNIFCLSLRRPGIVTTSEMKIYSSVNITVRTKTGCFQPVKISGDLHLRFNWWNSPVKWCKFSMTPHLFLLQVCWKATPIFTLSLPLFTSLLFLAANFGFERFCLRW